MEPLGSKISAYEEALDALPSKKTDDYEASVRTILIARDAIAHRIKDAGHFEEKTHDRVVAQDRRLKEVAKVVVKTLGQNTFVDWREAHQPPETSWWWYLDERVAKDAERAHDVEQKNAAFWIILTVLCVSGSIHLTVEITRRFIDEGGTWSATVKALLEGPLTVVHAGLGVLAFSTFTNTGREWAERLLMKLGLFEQYSFKKRFLIAAVIFILLLSFQLSLPAIARYYVERGMRFARQRDEASAVENFQRAIRLDPGNAQAHYNLAVMYEGQNDDLHNDKAIKEYLAALNLDNGFIEARNNLARLHIRNARDDQDLNHVLQTLTNAIHLSPEAWDVRYALHKNRGLVHLKLKHYAEADEDLRTAIGIDLSRPGRVDDLNDLAAPHCLRGYALEGLNRKEEAMAEWDTCARYHCSDEDLDPEWVRTAQQRKNTVGDCIK